MKKNYPWKSKISTVMCLFHTIQDADEGNLQVLIAQDNDVKIIQLKFSLSQLIIITD